MESDLFNSGFRPAVNSGFSVSRVGGSAQIKAMKQVAAKVKMELAQYTELLAFAQFGSDLDKATRDQLNRGERIMSILKQRQYMPMPVEKQVISFYIVTKGYVDDIDVEDVLNFEEELIQSMESSSDILIKIRETKEITKEIDEELEDFIKTFKKDFVH